MTFFTPLILGSSALQVLPQLIEAADILTSASTHKFSLTKQFPTLPAPFPLVAQGKYLFALRVYCLVQIDVSVLFQ